MQRESGRGGASWQLIGKLTKEVGGCLSTRQVTVQWVSYSRALQTHQTNAIHTVLQNSEIALRARSVLSGEELLAVVFDPLDCVAVLD